MRKQQFGADEVSIRRGLWGTGNSKAPGERPVKNRLRKQTVFARMELVFAGGFAVLE